MKMPFVFYFRRNVRHRSVRDAERRKRMWVYHIHWDTIVVILFEPTSLGELWTTIIFNSWMVLFFIESNLVLTITNIKNMRLQKFQRLLFIYIKSQKHHKYAIRIFKSRSISGLSVFTSSVSRKSPPVFEKSDKLYKKQKEKEALKRY